MSHARFHFGLALIAVLAMSPELASADVIGACVNVQATVVATRGATATNCDADAAVAQATNGSDIAARDAGKSACGTMTLAARRAVCANMGMVHRTDITNYDQISPANRGKFAVAANSPGRCVAVTSSPATVVNSTRRCVFIFDLGPQKQATVTSQARCGVICQ